MDKLSGAAGGALAEVFALKQQNIVAPCRCVDSDASSSGSASDDNNIPGLFSAADAGEHLIAIHRASLFQWSERPTASLQLSCRYCICFVSALGVKVASAARCLLSSSMPLQNPVASPAR